MLLIPTKPDYLSTNGIDSLGLKIRDFTDEYNEHGQRARSRRPARRPSSSRWCRATTASRSRRRRSVISRIEARRVPTFATTIRDSKSVYGPAPEHGVPVILGGTGRAATRELRDLVSELSDRLEGHRRVNEPDCPNPADRPDALADAARRRVSAALSPDDLAAVAAGRARLELRPVAPVQPDPAQLRLDGGPRPPVRAAAPPPRCPHTPTASTCARWSGASTRCPPLPTSRSTCRSRASPPGAEADRAGAGPHRACHRAQQGRGSARHRRGHGRLPLPLGRDVRRRLVLRSRAFCSSDVRGQALARFDGDGQVVARGRQRARSVGRGRAAG